LVQRSGRIHPPTLAFRVEGWMKTVSKLGMGLRMYFKGKIKLRAKTLRKVDEIKKIFELVKGDK
jgi:hypothetical protein